MTEGRVQSVGEALARLAELDVPEEALRPVREWIAEQVPCRCVEVEGYGMDRTACRADEHRDYCPNLACCLERGHEGDCDERAALR